MTHETHSPEPADPLASRREVLLATLAGATVLPRWLERPLSAAEEDRPPAPPTHPLDPLSVSELSSAVKLLRDARKLGDSYRFVSCTLDEPAKADVLGHRAGRPFPRRA